MKTANLILISVLALTTTTMAHSNNINHVLNDKSRPTEDMQRDDARKPSDIVNLLDIKPNMKVVDYLAGKGYYTDIFARVLNNSGKLYSVRAKLEHRDLSQFTNISQLSTLDLSDLNEPVDRIFTALNYHDLINKKDFDRKKLLKTIYNKLNDDGYFVVIDHNSAPGQGRNQSKTLHRVENVFVLNEILDAGFVLDRSLSVLANPDDHFELDVWQAQTKGKTDRFVYRFKKQIITQ